MESIFAGYKFASEAGLRREFGDEGPYDAATATHVGVQPARPATRTADCTFMDYVSKGQLFSADIVVFGLGNSLRTDEGPGIHALRALQNDSRVPTAVSLYDGGTLGLELACYAAQAPKIPLLDAMDVNEPTGTIVRMTGADLAGLPAGKSVHQLGLKNIKAITRITYTKDEPADYLARRGYSRYDGI